jgi:hypothetical protein
MGTFINCWRLAWMVSKYEVVHKIECIDQILTIIQELRITEIHELEMIEAKDPPTS